MPAKGTHITEEHRRKISESNSGKNHWSYGKHPSEETRTKMSSSHTGMKVSETTRNKMSESANLLYREHPEKRVIIGESQRGKPKSKEQKDKQSKSLKGRFTGDKSFNWKGGKTKRVMDLRDTRDYRIWKRAVKKRDNYTCVSCGCKEGKLHAHHIISISEDISKALDISNGETLCVKCHQKEHPFNLYFGRVINEV